MMKKSKVFLMGLACGASMQMNAQTLADSFKQQHWNGLAFVSTSMPRATLYEIAREAALTRSTMVLRGFDAKSESLGGAQQFVQQVNANCCGKNPPGWIVHPKLFEQYNVKKVPAFVLAKGANPSPSEFSIVSGDVTIANALKFMSQGSAHPEIRKRSSEIYTNSFSDH
ncbi:MAG: hypothetical protein RLY14_632 [Planctomycetota bacterium]|jgi:conjugal transfer pilus assembly protein TrbC